jgi:hypothetical protein
MATQQQATGKGRESANKRGAQTPAAAAGEPTSERDEIYGVVSVLYHALQGAETYSRYIQDARRAGDEELVTFFTDCQEEENQRAIRAKQLLAMRFEEEADVEDEDEDEDEDADEDEA